MEYFKRSIGARNLWLEGLLKDLFDACDKIPADYCVSCGCPVNGAYIGDNVYCPKCGGSCSEWEPVYPLLEIITSARELYKLYLGGVDDKE